MKGLAEELVLPMNLRRVWYNKISLLGILIWKRFQYGLVVGETGGKEVSWLCSSAAEEQEGPERVGYIRNEVEDECVNLKQIDCQTFLRQR